MKWYVYDLEKVPLPISLDVLQKGECSAIMPPMFSYPGRLSGLVSQTTDPNQADYFLVPLLFNIITEREFHGDAGRILATTLHALEWFYKWPSQHVVFMIGDCCLLHESCHASPVFMVSCSKFGRGLPMYYQAETPAEVSPIRDSEFLASFQGSVESCPEVRQAIIDSLNRSQRPVHCRKMDGYFHETYQGREAEQLRREFIRSLERSQFVFCPRGVGLSSLRFFETLAWGRVPILVADEIALPLPRRIPYEHFVVRIPEKDIGRWEKYVAAFLADHPDLQACSDLARKTHAEWFTDSSLKRFIESSLVDWNRY